jgi:hypothetical protein
MRSGSGLCARARDHNLTNDSEFSKALLTIGKSRSAAPPSVIVRSQHRLNRSVRIAHRVGIKPLKPFGSQSERRRSRRLYRRL